MSTQELKRRNMDDNGEFIPKLAKIIEIESQNPEQLQSIGFSQDGSEVVIYSEKKLMEKFRKFYRLGKWRSFVRQMNMYGFKKVNRGVRTCIYTHPIFRKGNSQNYHLITRSRVGTSRDLGQSQLEMLEHTIPFYEGTSIYSFMKNDCSIMEQVQSLLGDYRRHFEKLHKKNKKLIQKNLEAGREALNQMEACRKKKVHSMEQNLECSNLRSFGFSSFPSVERIRSSNLVIPEPILPSQQHIQEEGPVHIQDRSPQGINITSNSSFTSINNYLL